MLPASRCPDRPLRGQFQDDDWSRPAASGGNGSLIRILLRGVRSWLEIGELDRLGRVGTSCLTIRRHLRIFPSLYYFLLHLCSFFHSLTSHSPRAPFFSRFSHFSRLSNRSRFLTFVQFTTLLHQPTCLPNPRILQPHTRDTTNTATQTGSATHNEGICRDCSGFGCFGERCGNASKDRG